ncbi:hypothetical protein MKK84_17590 [Methylobacterium sp. E-065]|uniref:hypothetical protein n=1 Tax=Methylobacterium sp. E-065 TaxID=2836583 RepID=UPI001FBAC3EA|nr:hypothetical protein [Methylobacterium sp. E-065]MCJ2019231.1 hypothetical protein [Methylobacterium sp. E-065]
MLELRLPFAASRGSRSLTGIQALGDDDPILMGKRLTVTSTRLAWDRIRSTRSAFMAGKLNPR